MKAISARALALMILIVMLAIALPAAAREAEIISIPAADGYMLTGKLSLPEDIPAKRLVIYVNGSGPNTYDNHRTTGETEFNYFDVFAENLTKEGVAFFSYSTRGVTPGEEAPYFADIDQELYKTYLPLNSVSDVECMIISLLKDERLKGAEVYLLGWSEGTMIAPLVALGGRARVDELLLAGYSNQRMDEVLAWQQSGQSSIMFYQDYFDSDGNGSISQAEYEADPNGIVPYLGAAFAELDLDEDGALTAGDFFIFLKKDREKVINAFEGGDDAWISENYPVPLTSEWYLQHCELAPNRDTLPKLDLPIHIFHGTRDANVSVEGVYDVAAKFEELGKTNLEIHIYEGADHDLNYMQYIYTGALPEGLVDIFAQCRKE